MTSTEILPVGPPEPAPDTVAAPKKRRRGWIVALVIVAVVLLLGFVAFLVGEGYAKDYARDLVRARIIAVLGLPDDARVDVELGEGSIILQALSGRIDTVDIAVPDATFGALAGSVEAHAEGVPLDETAPVDVLRIDFAVAEDDLGAIAGNLSGLALDSIALDDPAIVVSSQFAVFGIPLELGMSLEPSASEGQLVFTPTSVRVGDNVLAVDDLLANPLFSVFARDLLKQQAVCIANALPQALVVTGADVEGDELVLSFTGDGAALGGPELSTPGTCPA